MEKENRNKACELDNEAEESGEQLLNEYHKQDKDDKHYMGYSVYGQTDNSCC